ncbi:MAG: excisionase family DNA-binding protein [Acidimicrobiales bacterium]
MTTNRLLTVHQVADRFGTTVRYPRYLIETRRIEFVRLGRKVRIPEAVVEAMIRDGTVPPHHRRRAA